MAEAFSPDMLYSHLLHADARSAADYLRRFPDRQALAQRYHERFALRLIDAPAEDETVNAVLQTYADYYHDACWVQMKRAAAEINLHDGLRALLHVDQPLQEMEDTLLPDIFAKAGYRFRGGLTGGLRGPYVWREDELRTYQVELPEGTREYCVRLLSGFIHKSWLDYISFGAISTGGWAEEDGTICCIRESYDTESENFRVSLLKHEAQHAADIQHYPCIRHPQLEYRAKLVELIYSTERDMLTQFEREADPQNAGDAHAWAAEQIIRDLCGHFACERSQLAALAPDALRHAARQLLKASTDTLVQAADA